MKSKLKFNKNFIKIKKSQVIISNRVVKDIAKEMNNSIDKNLLDLNLNYGHNDSYGTVSVATKTENHRILNFVKLVKYRIVTAWNVLIGTHNCSDSCDCFYEY